MTDHRPSERQWQAERREQVGAEGGDRDDLAILDPQHVEHLGPVPRGAWTPDVERGRGLSIRPRGQAPPVSMVVRLAGIEYVRGDRHDVRTPH